MYQISRQSIEAMTTPFGSNIKFSDLPSLIPDAVDTHAFPSHFIGYDTTWGTCFYTPGDYGFLYSDVILNDRILTKIETGVSNLNWYPNREKLYCGNPFGLKNPYIPKISFLNKMIANSMPRYNNFGYESAGYMLPYGYSIDTFPTTAKLNNSSPVIQSIFFSNDNIKFNNAFNLIVDNYIILTNSKNLFNNIIAGKTDIGILPSALVKETRTKYSYRGRENYYIQYVPDIKTSQKEIESKQYFSVFPYTLAEIAQKIKFSSKYMNQYAYLGWSGLPLTNFPAVLAGIASGFHYSIPTTSVFGIDVTNHSFVCGGGIINLTDMVSYSSHSTNFSMIGYYGDEIGEKVPEYAITEAACSDSVINMANAYTNLPYLKNAACGSNVINMYRSYAGCQHLTKPVSGPKVEIMAGTYSKCYRLNALKGFSFGPNVTNTVETFYDCGNLNDTLIIPRTTIDASYMYYNCGNDFDLSDVILYPYREYRRVDYSGCEVVLESGSKVENLAYAFCNAKVKFSIDFQKEGKNVINMSHAFAGARGGFNEQKDDGQSWLYLRRFSSGGEASPPMKWLFPQNVQDMSYAYAYCCGAYIHPSIGSSGDEYYLYAPYLCDATRPRWTNNCNNWCSAFAARDQANYTLDLVQSHLHGGFRGSLFITNHQARALNISDGAWDSDCIIFCYKDSPIWKETVDMIKWNTDEYAEDEDWKDGTVKDYLFGCAKHYSSLRVSLYKNNGAYCFYSPRSGRIWIKDLNTFTEADLEGHNT